MNQEKDAEQWSNNESGGQKSEETMTRSVKNNRQSDKDKEETQRLYRHQRYWDRCWPINTSETNQGRAGEDVEWVTRERGLHMHNKHIINLTIE